MYNDLYNNVLSEYYGINCCKKDKLTTDNSFWINQIIKDLKILGEWQTNLQTLFQ